MGDKLTYSITDWHQLKNVKSNNSRYLHISVADLIQADILTGLRIQVKHEQYGPLFTCVLNAQGTIVTEVNDNITVEPTTEQILAELNKWGFEVQFDQKLNLPQGQLDFLSELRSLGYDKLRILPVYTMRFGKKEYKPYIIVFNVSTNPDWLVNTYGASEQEFLKALKEGSAVNISATSKANIWSWGWLDFVADIDDILNEFI